MPRWLVDAQLPLRLVHRLRAAGADALHTSELPEGNRTTDHEINRVSLEQSRVVVTKDADFVDTFVRERRPYKLLLISAGNLRNADLLALFERFLGELDGIFETASFVEMNRSMLVLHE